MTNSKNTKKALFASMISMLLCVAMLIGSTFAWFTDNATTNVNTIQSGTLNIDIQDNQGNSLDGETLSFVDDAGDVLTNILWEPGCTYKLQEAKLVNLGNLALKYKVNICGVSGDVELANVIDVLINGQTAGTLAEMMADPDGAAYGQLMPKGETNDSASIGTIALHMQETAGNQYQNKTLTGVAITVNATQATVEKDSYTDQYDANAEYDDAYNGYAFVTVHNQDELLAAINAVAADTPTVIVLKDDQTDTYTFPLMLDKPTASMKNKTIVFKAGGDVLLDMNRLSDNNCQHLMGATLIFDGVEIEMDHSGWYVSSYVGLGHIADLAYRNCKISGAQYLNAKTVEFTNCTLESTNSYCITTYGGTDVTITGCTFNTAGKAVNVYSGGSKGYTVNVALTDCTFNSDSSVADDKAAVQVGDNDNKDCIYNVTISGCTANGFVTNNSTSPLWGNKNVPDERLTVTLDGTVVY